MSITLTLDPTEPTAVESAVRVDVAGASANDLTDYSTDQYPTAAELRCYLAFLLDSEELGRSYVFAVAQDGTHSFPNYIFPSAGSWSVELRDASDDSVLATQAVTVA